MNWTPEQYRAFQAKKIGKRIDKKLKFGNNPKIYNDVKYASTKEANYARDLDLLKRVGEILDWEYEPRFIFYAYGARITSYKIDFKIIHKDKSIEYVEIKGGKATQTQAWRIRWKFLKAYLAENEPDSKLTLKEN